MKLHLSGPSIYHRRWPNGHNCGFWIQASRMCQSSVQNFFVLLNSNIQRDIVGLGPSSKRAQPQDRFLVPFSLQILSCRAHQICMPGMCWITSLKGINRVGTLFLELLQKFLDGLSPLIKAVIISNPIQQFNLPTKQVVTTHVNILDVWMTHVNDTKHSSDNFFLSVVVNFDILQNCHSFTHAGYQRNILVKTFFNPRLGELSCTQSNGNRHVYPKVWWMLWKMIEVRSAF
mmetsp:Transcript_111417/g.322106  ORF Transcript_111417/g.322106 Transcript_111417/m.322106 type:complete len:231 (-) Transcript_111417:80-772(-)